MKFEALVEFFEVSFTDFSEGELDGVSSEELTISVYVSFTDLSEVQLNGVYSKGGSSPDLRDKSESATVTRIVTMSVLSEGFGGLLFVSKDSSINLYCPGSTPAALMSTTVDDERFFRVTKAS